MAKPAEPCPRRRELEAYAARQLSGKRNEQIFLHLKYCATCLRTMAQLTAVPSPDDILRGKPAWWRRVQQWLRSRL